MIFKTHNITFHLKALVFLTLVLFSFAGCSSDKKAKRILFIGNSYTYRNNMPLLFEKIAQSKGKSVEVCAVTTGRFNFFKHAHSMKVIESLKNEKWDVIILQGSSRDMLRDSSFFNHKTYPAVSKLMSYIQKFQKSSQTYFYMTWPYRNGVRKDMRFSNPDTMLLAVENGYNILSAKYQVPIIPVGKVFRSFYKNNPQIDLYVRDNSHPSFYGSYLVACTMYEAIFKNPLHAIPNFSIGVNQPQQKIQHFINQQFKFIRKTSTY